MPGKIIAAIGLDLQGRVSDTHFGDSAAICFAEIGTGPMPQCQIIVNPLKKVDEAGHGDAEKLAAAQDLLGKVMLVVAGRMSPNFKKMREKKGKLPVVSSLSLKDTLDYLTIHLDEIKAYFADPENIYLKI